MVFKSMAQIQKGMNTYSIEIGSKYGFWLVLEKGPSRTCKSLCLCTKCNQTQKLVRNLTLTTGVSTSCGCDKEKIEVDKLYGFWKVVELQGVRSLCICTGCNQTTKSVLNRNLKIGRSSSCGCRKLEIEHKTNLAKYGTTHQHISLEARQKQRKTNLEKYGTEIPSKNSKVREKISNSKKAHSVEEKQLINEKRQLTCLEKYGSTNVGFTQWKKERSKATNVERYGTEYYVQSEFCKKRNYEKYGLENPLLMWRKTDGLPSKGEELINEILQANQIFFEREYSFDDCRNVYPLSFDFYLPSENILIEYDGEQHFRPARFGGISKEEASTIFESTKFRDKIKTEYAKKRGILLIRISYTEDIEFRMTKILEVLKERHK